MTSSIDIESLNRRFGIANHVQFSAGPGGLTLVTLNNSHAQATLVLEGGQVLTYEPAEQPPVLWLSPQARYEAGKSVRGGIPVCWPWFGPHASDASKPAHGFARNSPWRVSETQALNDGATRVVLELNASESMRSLWPHPGQAQLHVSVGSHLVVELVTVNSSSDPIPVTEALHTYLNVSDIENIEVNGLAGTRYIDKVQNVEGAVQNGAIRFAGETDRVYLATEAVCEVLDPQLGRKITVSKKGSRSTVVWNPWIEKGKKLGDLGDNGYRNMVCVETANALDDVVIVAPHSSHTMTTILASEPIG